MPMDLLSNSYIEQVSYRKIVGYGSNKQIHNLFRYPAKLIPEIVVAHLNDEFVPNDGIIYDPFCGSGTVMVEAQKKGYKSIGTDINPLSFLISSVKTTLLDWELVENKINRFQEEVRKIQTATIPEFTNRDYWFNKHMCQALGKIKWWVETVEEKKVRDFFEFVFASVIRKVSNADPAIFPPTFSAERKKELEKKDEEWVFSLVEKRAKQSLNVLKNHFQKMEKIPTVECILGSATEKLLPDNSVDLIITSPPYINAQKYIRTTKFELFWLEKEKNDSIRELDRKIIGTERVYQKEFNINDVKGKFWEKEVKRLILIDKRRAQIVHNYFIEMEKAINNCYDYLKDKGFFVLIIGNNTIRGQKIYNNVILHNIALQHGFSFIKEKSKKDKIRNRSLPEKRNKTAGVMDYEYIMIFQKN